VQGQDIGAKVCYRDADTIAFNDKFPVSENHLDIIPTEVYADVTVLGKEHVAMLETLYEAGKKEFLSRNLGWLPSDEPLDSFITAGYNFPVSVKHLHLHMVLPPVRLSNTQSNAYTRV
jgi:diadenosine tetraphosphate (Ap4A) HIT family hydrolase